MGLFSFIFKDDAAPGKQHEGSGLKVDIHSHFLPGIDDGSISIDETIIMAKAFVEFGYEKIITTPHIIADLHPNTPEVIHSECEKVQQALDDAGIPLKIEAAAEYFFEENFLEQIERKEALLTFGSKYLLFETPMMNEPVRLKEALFEMRLQGYKPVMAHPERYNYFLHRFELIEELFDAGLMFQINILSLTGRYGKAQQKLAETLIEKEMVHWLGTDCHREKHLAPLHEAFKSKFYAKCLQLPLLNDTLLNAQGPNTIVA